MVSTLVAITLLPIVLAKFGGSSTGRTGARTTRRADVDPLGRGRCSTPLARCRLGMAVVFALVGASFGLQLGTSDANTLAQGGDAKDGLDALVDSGVGEGALLPHEILIDGSTPPDEVAAALREVEGIHGAVAPSDESWSQNGTALVEAIPSQTAAAPRARRTWRRCATPRMPRGPTSRWAASPPRTRTSSTPSTAASR